MRRPSRLTLAAAAAVLPLTLVSACSAATDDGGVRTENGSGVDGKSEPGENEDGDQSDTDDMEDEG